MWRFLLCSEWVLGNREDLAKDIIAELQPENGEVSLVNCCSEFLEVRENSSES